jgi:uncharacterized lipoprotein YbaY/predicted small secreted protein
MKKTWSLLALVMIAVLLLAACGTREGAPGGEAEATAEPAPTVEAPAAVEPTLAVEAPAAVEPTPTVEAAAPVEPTPTVEAPAPVEPTPTVEAAAPVEPTPTVEAAAPAEPDPLAGTSWRWVSLTQADGTEVVVPDPENYLLSFEPEGMFALKADCNTVSGSYTVDGQSIAIMLGPSTMAFCGEESLDQMYLAALAQAATFQFDGDALTTGLAGDAGSMSFAAVAAEEPMAEAAPAEPTAAVPGLTNVLWQWDRFTEGAESFEVPDPEAYQLAFLADGQFALRADCNRGRGRYEAGADGSIMLDVGPMTRAMCGPDSLDNRFLEYLGSVTTYSIAEGGLYLDLTTDSGDVMNLSAGGAAVTGQVTYLQRSALPPDAVVEVTINDVSRADAPQIVIGEQIIPTEGRQAPFPFAVSYDPSLILENHTYAVRARITDAAGKLLFTSDTVIPVITRGNPVSDVELTVVPAP